MDYYGKGYYDAEDYENRARWEPFFRSVAQHIVEDINPKTVLDVGCSVGYMVQMLRELGVEAWGIDNSVYAIDHASNEIQPYLRVASATQPLPGDLPQKYDLVLSIEVIEHLRPEESRNALALMCSYTDRILFSSTDSDINNPTHVNVQQREYWAEQFAQYGFFRELWYDTGYLSPCSAVYSAKKGDAILLVADYERALRYEKFLRKKQEEINVALATDKEQEQRNQAAEIARLTYQLKELETVQQTCADLRKQLDDSEGSCADLRKQLDDSECTCTNLHKQLDDSKDACADLRHEIGEYSNSVAFERATAATVLTERDQYRQNYEVVLHSTCWKLTKPIRWVMDSIKLFARIFKKTILYFAHHGMRNTLRRSLEVLHTGTPTTVTTCPSTPVPTTASLTPSRTGIKITENPVDGIACILTNEKIKRLNLVTDSIDAKSLFGGVATSLILATEFANTNDYELRIITRNAPINPLDYMNIMKFSSVAPAKKCSFYSDWDRAQGEPDYKMELSADDVFMATSWWSVEAIKKTSLRREMFYVIQEVETFFYNYGPEHLLAAQAMQDEHITYIVNSHYLYDYFKTHATNVVENGIYFEPAFPRELYQQGDFLPKKTYRLFFYARPNNPRNMYAYGVKLLNRAMNEGILDADEWEICFAGQSTDTVSFDNGVHPKMLGVLPWTEYGKFLTTVDVALCLMYTPHPSYPPFDVASSGGVVVTNQFENKTTFPQCENVLMGTLDEESMLDTLADAVARAKNMEQRKAAFEGSTIPRQWQETLKESIAFMEERLHYAEN